ncbi:Zn(2)-C6 fungal-type domain-containing protein [Mycena kentingensis (nom. inval.)]|nr:Zn(2)-C6 fungal-type domain-containing protein [Mycena kentingensis (nom. inval.)]
MSSPEPRLPPELERLILEFAALSFPKHAVALLTVAKRFHVWLLPRLWRTLRQRYRDALPPSWLSKSSEFLAANVRHLSMDSDRPGLVIPNKILPSLQPHRLAIPLGDVYGSLDHPTLVPLASQPTFSRLTHFDVFDSDDARMVPFLAALPALTHLAVNEGETSDIPAILQDCKRLQVLIQLVGDFDDAERLQAHMPVRDDPRLCVCVYVDWDEAVLEGWTFWDDADEFVAAKRAGRISADKFYASSANR